MEEEQKAIDWDKAEERENSNNYHKFNDKPIVVGKIISVDTEKNETVLENADGEITIGNLASLKDRITPEDIGKTARIEKTGEEKSKSSGRSYFTFSVKVK